MHLIYDLFSFDNSPNEKLNLWFHLLFFLSSVAYYYMNSFLENYESKLQTDIHSGLYFQFNGLYFFATHQNRKSININDIFDTPNDS